MLRRFIRAALVFSAGILLPAAPALAQAPYPNHTIRILVPIPPGGAPDVAARLLGQAMGEVLKQPVVIENRTGANGNIAAEAAAKADPDGYTLLLAADSGIVINPHVYRNMAVDPLKDLVPVSSVASNQFLLAINPQLPAHTFQEFIDYARRADPPLAYASGGNGSQQQFAMELLKRRAGINLMHVPYRGGAPSAQATIAGETKALFAGASAAGLFQSGQLRALAASGKKRSRLFPDLPTISEFYPGFEIDIWLGLFAPAGTPAPIVDTLRQTAQAVLARPDFAAKLNVSGSLEPLILPPDEFAALIQRDSDKYDKLVRDIGIKAE